MGLFGKDRDLSRPPERVEIEVRSSTFRLPAEGFAIRLDAFLQHHLRWRSRTSIKRLVADGYVFVDPAPPDRPGRGELAVERRASRKLRNGARVVVVIPEELRLPPPAGDASELTVLYEDDALLALDKPPLLPVHPSGRHQTDTLIQRVHARYRAANEGLRIPIRLCHRIDRETSGVVLCGKGVRNHSQLMKQFERRTVEKEYLAVVDGDPEADEGRIELPLGPARASGVRLEMAVVADGLPSRTDWRVVERHPGHALLACRLMTGRQHQIRVHLAAIGHPVVGDKLYGGNRDVFLREAAGTLTDEERAALPLPRHALHSHRLAIDSPLTGVRVEIVSPLAPDLRAFLARR